MRRDPENFYRIIVPPYGTWPRYNDRPCGDWIAGSWQTLDGAHNALKRMTDARKIPASARLVRVRRGNLRMGVERYHYA